MPADFRTAPLVGRAELVAAFECALRAASQGAGGLILLAGEPGIGPQVGVELEFLVQAAGIDLHAGIHQPVRAGGILGVVGRGRQHGEIAEDFRPEILLQRVEVVLFDHVRDLVCEHRGQLRLVLQ